MNRGRNGGCFFLASICILLAFLTSTSQAGPALHMCENDQNLSPRGRVLCSLLQMRGQPQILDPVGIEIGEPEEPEAAAYHDLMKRQNNDVLRRLALKILAERNNKIDRKLLPRLY